MPRGVSIVRDRAAGPSARRMPFAPEKGSRPRSETGIVASKAARQPTLGADQLKGLVTSADFERFKAQFLDELKK